MTDMPWRAPVKPLPDLFRARRAVEFARADLQKAEEDLERAESAMRDHMMKFVENRDE